MMRFMALRLACMAVVAYILVVGGPSSANAMTCGRFLDKFSKCNQYARGGTLEEACCQGLRDINAEDKTQAARQQSCNCMVNMLKNVPGLIPSRAANIPTLCRVTMPYPISTTADCKRVTLSWWSII